MIVPSIRNVLVGLILVTNSGRAIAQVERRPLTMHPQPPGHFEHPQHHELPQPDFARFTESGIGDGPVTPLQQRTTVERDGYVSIQVNVDANGDNVFFDAANEPSIAVDPTNPNVIVIGWRQFDNVYDDFRQAGWAYSHDGGATWTANTLDPGVFRSDPVLGADADGNIYYYSLSVPDRFLNHMFKSTDGGVTWDAPVWAFGGDKAWFTIDRTNGPGRGHIYASWSIFASCCQEKVFNRSTHGGASFSFPIPVEESPRWELWTSVRRGSCTSSAGLVSGRACSFFVPTTPSSRPRSRRSCRRFRSI